MFADDWIRTADLWCGKRPLYKLSHNHCPIVIKVYSYKFFCYILNILKRILNKACWSICMKANVWRKKHVWMSTYKCSDWKSSWNGPVWPDDGKKLLNFPKKVAADFLHKSDIVQNSPKSNQNIWASFVA